MYTILSLLYCNSDIFEYYPTLQYYIVISSEKGMIHDMIKLNTLNYILQSNIVIYIRYFRYIQYQS